MTSPETGFEAYASSRWPTLYRTAYLLTGDPASPRTCCRPRW